MELSGRLADFLVGTEYDRIPAATVAQAKERILDTLGAALAGYAGWDYTGRFLAACATLGTGGRPVIGPRSGARFPAARAAMINAAMAHAVELDDGHKNAGVHAGAVVVATALTLGADLGRTGKEVLTAVVLGYEVAYRLAVGMSPSLIDGGFHPSAICGTVAAAAVAGKLMGLTRDRLANALGLSGLFASGLMEATVSGQQSKCVMVGQAALNGISAACYAKQELEGPLTVFEGKSGMLRAMGGRADPDVLLHGLGEPFWIKDTYNKFYPTCRHAQPAIEAARELAREHRLDWREVERVLVDTHRVAYRLTGTITGPKNPGEAKFSIPYGVALALIDREVAVRHLTAEFYEDPRYLELARRVTVRIDPRMDALYPERRGASVEILMKDTSSCGRVCYDLKGSPQNPAGVGELRAKFAANAAGLLDANARDRLLERTDVFERETDLTDYLALLNW